MQTDTMPSKAHVAAALAAALGALTDARQQLVVVTGEYAAQKARLQVAEDLVLLGGTCDGKNEAVREAQLRQATADHREAFQRVELERVVATMAVQMEEDRLKTWRATAYLLGGE